MTLPRNSISRPIAILAIFLWALGARGEHYTLPLLVPAGASAEPHGVVRILNGTAKSGTVKVYAIDDSGVRSGPATFTLNALEAIEFSAADLQSGNADLGLTGGIGTGVGDTRLVIETDLDIVPLAFVRAAEGTLSAMHDTVRGVSSAAESGVYTYEVPIFNLSTEMLRISRLRLINPGDMPAAVTISGQDDTGAAATAGGVLLTLAAGGAKTLTAQQLEAGDTGLTGRLGAGVGRWRLTVSSDQPLQVVNIVASIDGFWTNLSTTPVSGAAPANQEGLNGRFVDESVVYETSTGSFKFNAMNGERFMETVESDGVTTTNTGSYSYAAIGPDAGRLTLEYNDGGQCQANFYFSSRTHGWFASFCTGSDDPDGYWIGGSWTVETYEVNDALPGVPTSGTFVPTRTSVGSTISTRSDGTTITLNENAYFELSDGTRYACASAAGCTVLNGTVTRGTLTKRTSSSGDGGVDRFPTFRTAVAPGDRSYTAGTTIEALTLPEASSGNAPLRYSLAPQVPGLTFNAAMRQLTGTPSTPGSYTMTYSVTDDDGATALLTFTIRVTDEAGSLGDCYVGLLVGIGQSCTYPGTTDEFSVNGQGRGRILDRLFGIRVRIDNETINGRVYDFEASNQGDDLWRIDRIAGSRDLAVSLPSVSDNSPETGGSFTLSATVTNRGDGSSRSTTLRYYRSTDATITTSDTSVGTDAVKALAASEISVESIALTAPSTPGTYYYGACVDAVSGETDTTNNCSASVPVTVSAPQMNPDLVVGVSSVSDNSPETGGSFTLSATVTNRGDGSSRFTTLRYYRSTDATITTSDTSVGTDAVGALAASGSSGESIALSAPPDPGTYYYGACVDAVSGETDTTNNCSASITVSVSVPPTNPDLEVGVPSVSDNSPETGGSFTLSATVTNGGDGSSQPTTLRYYRSMDATITTSDTSVGTDAVAALAASGSSSEAIALTAPSNAGTYYYGACVDAVSGETDTTNNCSASVRVTISEQTPDGGPDLVVYASVIVPGLFGVYPGDSLTLRADVRNDGNKTSPSTTLRYYRSTDSTITTSDTSVDTDAVRALEASEISLESSFAMSAPSTPGTYYYGACVDAVSGETDTTNNCSASVPVTVLGPQTNPDLVVGVPSVSNNSPETGGSFTLSATVSNRGDGASQPTTLRYYRSQDATITPSDTSVGTNAVGALPASAWTSRAISLTAPSIPSTYYYGACVEAVSGETDTTNNCSASVRVTVSEP